jgi:hypothetical protein
MPKKPRNEFERGWTACIAALKALSEETYPPMDLVGTAVSDLIARLKLPSPTKVAPGEEKAPTVNFYVVFQEMHRKHFGIDVAIVGPCRGALGMLKEAFPAGSEAEFRAIVKQFFKDHDDQEINRRGLGHLMRYLPDRVTKYRLQLAEMDYGTDDAPQFSAGDAAALRGVMTR